MDNALLGLRGPSIYDAAPFVISRRRSEENNENTGRREVREITVNGCGIPSRSLCVIPTTPFDACPSFYFIPFSRNYENYERKHKITRN